MRWLLWEKMTSHLNNIFLNKEIKVCSSWSTSYSHNASDVVALDDGSGDATRYCISFIYFWDADSVGMDQQNAMFQALNMNIYSMH